MGAQQAEARNAMCRDADDAEVPCSSSPWCAQLTWSTSTAQPSFDAVSFAYPSAATDAVPIP